MRLDRTFLSLWLCFVGATGAWADIVIKDAYFRSASPNAKAGAVFLVITNTGSDADRLIGAETGIAGRVELHTHVASDGGVMQMREVEGGFEIPAGADYALQRGGDHVMLMGLTTAIADGETVDVTLIFEQAGRIELTVPVDRSR